MYIKESLTTTGAVTVTVLFFIFQFTLHALANLYPALAVHVCAYKSLAFVSFVFPPAVLPVGHVIPLACALPLYVLSSGLEGQLNELLLTVTVYVAPVVFAKYVAPSSIVTFIVVLLLSLVFATGVIVNVFPLILQVATVVSLLVHLSVPSPVLVIVLVPVFGYVNVPLVGESDTVLDFFSTGHFCSLVSGLSL